MKKLISLFLVVTMLATMAAAFAINTSAEEALTAKAYSPADDAQYLYVVFNKPVTLGSDVLASPTYLHQYNSYLLWYAAERTDETVKISDQVYKFTVSNWKAAGYADNLLNPTADGWYFSQGVSVENIKLALFGTVTAFDGTKLALTDPEDSSDNFAGRFHYDMSGTNYHGGYLLSYEKVDSVANIPVPKHTAISANTFDAALSVDTYFAQNGTNLYLVFNKPVSIPTEARLCRVGHGWPVEGDGGAQVFRYLRRMSDSDAVNNQLTNIEYFGDTKQVLKVTVADPTPANYDWYYNPTGSGSQYEKNAGAGATGDVSKDFCLMVFGEFKTVDGKETLVTENFGTVDLGGFEPVLKGTKTTWNVVATTDGIVIPKNTAISTNVSISVKDDVNFNIYADVAGIIGSKDMLPDSDVIVKIGDRESKLTDATKVSETGKITIPVSPAQFNDKITVSLVDTDTTVTVLEDYTVYDYCQYIISNYDDDNVVELCKTLINYGIEAQAVFDDGYAGEAIAEGYTSVYSATQRTATVFATDSETYDPEMISFLALDKSGVRFYYNPSLGEEVSIDVGETGLKKRDGEVNGYKEDGELVANALNYVQVEAIEAVDLGTEFTVTVNGLSVAYSALQCVYDLATIEPEFTAFYNVLDQYYQAALACFN